MRGAGRLGRLLVGCGAVNSSAKGAERQAFAFAGKIPAAAASRGQVQPSWYLGHGRGAARHLGGAAARALNSASDAALSSKEQEADAALDEAVNEILTSEQPSQPVIEKAADAALQEATLSEAAATGTTPPTPAADMPLPEASSSSGTASQAAPASASQAADALSQGEVAGAAAAAQAVAKSSEQKDEVASSRNEVLQHWINNWTAFSSKLGQHNYYEDREHKPDSDAM